jgi:hypothetical protein
MSLVAGQIARGDTAFEELAMGPIKFIFALTWTLGVILIVTFTLAAVDAKDFLFGATCFDSGQMGSVRYGWGRNFAEFAYVLDRVMAKSGSDSAIQVCNGGCAVAVMLVIAVNILESWHALATMA